MPDPLDPEATEPPHAALRERIEEVLLDVLDGDPTEVEAQVRLLCLTNPEHAEWIRSFVADWAREGGS